MCFALLIRPSLVSTSSALLSRLKAGPPLVLGSDPSASLRLLGAHVDGPFAIGRLIREDPALIANLYARDAEAGADVLCALTAETMGPALLPIGMAFRAAALTRRALELAQDAARAASKPTLVAGIIGNAHVKLAATERVAEECSLHAARLLSDGCDLIVARSFGAAEGAAPGFERFSRLSALISGTSTRMPTWVLAELEQPSATVDGESIPALINAAEDAGAQALLLSVPSAELGLVALSHAKAARNMSLGVLLAAPEKVKPDAPASSPEVQAWAKNAQELVRAGARIIGGGSGTSFEHIRALALVAAGELECE